MLFTVQGVGSKPPFLQSEAQVSKMPRFSAFVFSGVSVFRVFGFQGLRGSGVQTMSDAVVIAVPEFRGSKSMWKVPKF